MILNLGTIDLKKCSEIYRQCSVVLQPSLLEVFSATYIEAMYFQRPLLVPDVVFARDICKKVRDTIKEIMIYQQLRKLKIF